MAISKDYIVAEGPAGLRKILEELLEKSKQDLIFAKQEHYILYQLGQQKAMIRVDAQQAPFYFWHYDLMGRPATLAVKETLADFLWEHWGQKMADYNA